MKQSAASAVLNRIPASANATIWTVMNMQRSAKIMRLIDADELIEDILSYILEGKECDEVMEYLVKYSHPKQNLN